MKRLVMLLVFVLLISGCDDEIEDTCDQACLEQGFSGGGCELFGVQQDPCENEPGKVTITSQEGYCPIYRRDGELVDGLGNMCCCFNLGEETENNTDGINGTDLINQTDQNNQTNQTIVIGSCIDSDGGKVYDVWGYVILNNTKEYVDACISDFNIREYYCDNATPGNVALEIHSCFDVCSGGECIVIETNTTNTTNTTNST
ncbi:hypothetical protein K8R33_00395 [archaeon]|nr:hypothetical protein [archaeon]